MKSLHIYKVLQIFEYMFFIKINLFGILALNYINHMKNWVHIIGICGVTTSGLAVSFKKNGWIVTGSDKGFFPPVSEYLKKYDIKILPGFKKERLTINGNHPNLVIYQGTKGRFNTEILEAKELNLNIQSYPEVLKDFLINKNKSIVITGSYGKTTTTAILVNILKYTNIKLSYMYGGLNPDFSPNIVFNPDSEMSVIEGDEYITSYQDMTSKFFHYKPTIVLLTGVVWDHADVFKTQNQYIENFKEFISTIPPNGCLVVNANDPNSVEIAKESKSNVIFYSSEQNKALVKPDWYLMYDSKPFPCVVKNLNGDSELEIIPFERTVIGKINDQNILTAIVLARILNIKKVDIQKGIKEFKGIKRRMEVRYKNISVTVIDDFGSTPAKARQSLKNLKEDFPNTQKIIIFEPSAGSRNLKALGSYENAFENSDLVILPRFTSLSLDTKSERFDEAELEKILLKYKYNVEFINDDDFIIKYIVNLVKSHSNTTVLFMGSHSFRKIIPNLIEILKNGKE